MRAARRSTKRTSTHVHIHTFTPHNRHILQICIYASTPPHLYTSHLHASIPPYLHTFTLSHLHTIGSAPARKRQKRCQVWSHLIYSCSARVIWSIRKQIVRVYNKLKKATRCENYDMQLAKLCGLQRTGSILKNAMNTSFERKSIY